MPSNGPSDRPRALKVLATGTPYKNGASMLLSKREPGRDGPGRSDWSYASDDALAAVEARDAFRAHLRAIGCPEHFVEKAQVVFGELVGNVVRHAPGPIGIALTWKGPIATIAVTDSGRSFQCRQALPADPLADGGRGLFIVRSLATGFRIQPLPGGGKEIRVSLHI
jgi:anti-sigma regulatory factor (Ser/Thr protein kinase)